MDGGSGRAPASGNGEGGDEVSESDLSISELKTAASEFDVSSKSSRYVGRRSYWLDGPGRCADETALVDGAAALELTVVDELTVVGEVEDSKSASETGVGEELEASSVAVAGADGLMEASPVTE